uniref:Uncharacterized protein n=1 Tax=Heterorhabditis bacteriophora TaxID=37862 RepID=A0A1I7WWE1_HETBA
MVFQGFVQLLLCRCFLQVLILTSITLCVYF